MNLRQLIQKIKKKQISKSDWLIIALAGVLILIILLPTKGKTEEAKETKEKQTEAVTDTVTDTSTSLELQLESILSQVDGVGEVKVMITYKDSGTQVIEKDSDTTNNTSEETDSGGGSRITQENNKQETTVYDELENGSTPFVSKELKPEIEGILVVAQGGDKTLVKQNISEAVLALFQVEAHRIKIVKMN